MFNKAGIRYIESYQTLMESLEVEEEPKKGADRGGFVVIAGVKE